MSVPSLKILCRETYEARAKWKFLLIELDVGKPTIDAISSEKWKDPDDCLCEGLSKWLDGGERFWRDVVNALSSNTVGHKDLADRIERQYLQSIASVELAAHAFGGQQQQHGEKWLVCHEEYCRSNFVLPSQLLMFL